MNKLRLALALLCFVYAFRTAAQTSFNVTYSGFTPEAETAFAQAVSNWSNVLVSAVPIKVHAHFGPLLPGMLGITLPNGRRDFNGAPLAGTWYASSLANAIAGVELNPGESDMDVYLNSSVSWHYGTSGSVPAGQYDLVSVAMHEMGHGFGFVSLANKDGSMGSLGTLEHSDFFSIPISFPWPNLDTLPSIFDRFLIRNNGARLDTMANPSAALGSVLTSNNIFFDGPNATAANGGNSPRIYAPGTFELGSSLSHFNETTFPTGNANEMMTPNGATGNANHQPGPVALGVLQDIGWNLNPTMGLNGIEANDLVVFPNPSNGLVHMTLPSSYFSNGRLLVTDCSGKPVFSDNVDVLRSIDLSHLAAGCYIVQLQNNNTVMRTMILKQ